MVNMADSQKGDKMNEVLIHHGIKGQHWGVRRFQNADGSLTNAGEKRYYDMGNGNFVKKSGATRRAEKRLRKAEYNNDWKDKNGHEIKEIRNNKGKVIASKDEINVYKAESKANLAKAQANLAKAQAKDKQKAELHAQGKLTGKEKVAIGVGVAAVTAVAATIAVKKLNDRNTKIEMQKGKYEIEKQLKLMDMMTESAKKNGNALNMTVDGNRIMSDAKSRANNMSLGNKIKNVVDNRNMQLTNYNSPEGIYNIQLRQRQR